MENKKKTVIVGASTNPARYAYKAAHLLTRYGHPIVPLSIKKGSVAGEDILDLRKKPEIPDVNTVTLYVGPQNQPEWYEYIISLSPERIIFNPGTENSEFIHLIHQKGIEAVLECTLIMLQAGTY